MATIPIKEAIQDALDELSRKSLHQVQIETAVKWAGRACAAAMLGRPNDAEEYAHEAIEHAALAGDLHLLQAVRNAMRSCNVKLPGVTS